MGSDRFWLVLAQTAILGLAFAATGFPILIHVISPPLAIVVCVSCALWIAGTFERAVPTFLIVAYTFQNVFVSLASGYAADSAALDSMKIYDFLSSVAVWIVIVGRYLLSYREVSAFVHRLMLMTTAVLALAGLYYVAGLPIDARGATIYMRNIGLPILLFQVCLLVGSRHEFALNTIVALILGALVACGYFELFFEQTWLTLTNGWTYWDISAKSQMVGPAAVKAAHEQGFVVTSILDLMRTSFLNTNILGDLDLTVVRLQGPNFHPISFGYVLSVMITIAAVQGRVLLPLLGLPLLLLVGAKGAIVFLVVSVGFCMIARRYRGALLIPGLAAALILYAVAAFISGMELGDYHVLGFLGGLRGFVANPLGHTLGQGGNLSTKFANIDWTIYQHAGTADIAVESGIGVMLYQMGLATIPVILIYLWLSGTAWRLYKRLGAPTLALSCVSIVVILVNGIFQEEALFAPLALGLIMALVGLTFGSVDRLSARSSSSGRSR